MKKTTLLTIFSTFALATSALATISDSEQEKTCQYTFLQNMIRDARSHEKIFELIRSGVPMEDPTITCGGSLLQLAIRRGNPSIVNGILTQDKSRANTEVSLKGFNIPNAPDTIPVILFAAYYAPSELVFKVMTDAGADITVKDSNGHDILWYLDKNPVLRRSQTEDTIQSNLQTLLIEQIRKQSTKPQPPSEPETQKTEKKSVPLTSQDKTTQDTLQITP